MLASAQGHVIAISLVLLLVYNYPRCHSLWARSKTYVGVMSAWSRKIHFTRTRTNLQLALHLSRSVTSTNSHYFLILISAQDHISFLGHRTASTVAHSFLTVKN